jgi:glycosyltransferase involved in cell wall biosynthesis
MNPVISIIHPSYKRPELAAKCAKMWLDRCKDKSRIEYLLVLSQKDDLETYANTITKYQYGLFDSDLYVLFCPEANYVKQNNFGATHAKGNIFVNISDDFECLQDWDESLIIALEGKEDYVVKTQDGIQPYIMTMPLMDRKFYERFGYVLYPGYNHMYCDNDLADVGRLTGRTITLDLLFPHNHYSVGKMEKDAVNEENDSHYGVDYQTYLKRQQSNFGLN